MDERQLNCLICEVPITECRLGINCCRACSVFYKRTLSMKRALKCKGGDDECMAKNPTTSCRKCRYARFEFVLASCGVDSAGKEGNEVERMEGTNASTAFIDYEAILCLTRKNGELGTCTPQVVGELLNGSIKFAPATYKTCVPNTMIMYGGLLDFARMVFDDFRKISLANQHIIMKRNFDFMGKIIDLYRSVHYFPNDDTVLTSYTTYFSLETMNLFLSDCPPEIKKDEASTEISRNFNRTLTVNKSHFKRVQPSRAEFVALLGLALWNDHTVDVDDQMAQIVKRNRSSIMDELHKYYSTKGDLNYASRLGELLCLLVNVEKVSSLMDEDNKVYSLMNMFNEYGII